MYEYRDCSQMSDADRDPCIYLIMYIKLIITILVSDGQMDA